MASPRGDDKDRVGSGLGRDDSHTLNNGIKKLETEKEALTKILALVEDIKVLRTSLKPNLEHLFPHENGPLLSQLYARHRHPQSLDVESDDEVSANVTPFPGKENLPAEDTNDLEADAELLRTTSVHDFAVPKTDRGTTNSATEYHPGSPSSGYVKNQSEVTPDYSKSEEADTWLEDSPRDDIKLSGSGDIPDSKELKATWVKVKREYILEETLNEFALPWQFDEDDNNFIIIKATVDDELQSKLFSHTKELKEATQRRYRPKVTEIIRGPILREGRNFVPNTGASVGTDKAIADLSWSQVIRNRARFHSFEKFQIMNLYRKQHKLATELSDLSETSYFSKRKNDDDEDDEAVSTLSGLYKWDSAESLLEDYMKALRDLHWTKTLKHLSWAESRNHTQELMDRFSNDAYTSPLVFDMTPYVDLVPQSKASDPVRGLLSWILPDSLTAQDRMQRIWHLRYQKLGVPANQVPPIPLTESTAVDYLARLLLAVFTSGMLLAPIIAMSFVDTQNLRLVIASVFVVGFSIILSFIANVSNQEIIGGAAAYAAIIVVFVGSALSSST